MTDVQERPMDRRQRSGAVALVVLLLSVTVLVGGTSTAAAAEPAYNPYGAQGSVYRLYQAAFLREPDTGGFQHWERVHANGVPMGVIAQHFVESPEFRSRYQHLDDRAFVRLVYRNVLEREPDAGGYQHWTGAMQAGMTRGQLLLSFSESDEFVAKTYEGHPPGYRWVDPFDIARNYLTHDGSDPRAYPLCTGVMSLCLGDHIDLAYQRLGTPEYDTEGSYEVRAVGWRFGNATVTIEFDWYGRATAFDTMLATKGPTKVAVTSSMTLGSTTMEQVAGQGSPAYDVEYSQDCAYESYGYWDDRSTVDGMGDRVIVIGTRDCPFMPEESWHPVISWASIFAPSGA